MAAALPVTYDRRIWLAPLGGLMALSVIGSTAENHSTPAQASASIDTGDTAWMLTATALVLLMTPGLSFFYAGMVDRRNVISTMLQSFVAMGLVSILWTAVGFSLAFGDSIGGIIGDPRTFLKGPQASSCGSPLRWQISRWFDQRENYRTSNEG